MTKNLLSRYLKVPADIDAAAIAMQPGQPAELAFSRFFRDVVMPTIPWGAGETHETLVSLLRLTECAPGEVVEMREREHQALVAAMASARAKLSPEAFMVLLPFFTAVATASTDCPRDA